MSACIPMVVTVSESGVLDRFVALMEGSEERLMALLGPDNFNGETHGINKS